MRILAVDDDPVSLAKLKNILKSLGSCETCTEGLEGMVKFKEAHEKGEPFDLITLDIDMPGLKGQEVVGMIRDWEKQNQKHLDGTECKIIMVTVMTDGLSFMESFKEGCEGYLIKPFDRRSVMSAISKIGLQI